MILISFALTVFLVLSPTDLAAETKHHLDAHAHGQGSLNIAVEGKKVLMELEVPGSDIVGFEHAARSAEDKSRMEKAKKVLNKPLELFTLPDEAQCTVETAKLSVLGEADEEHDHKDEKYTGSVEKPSHSEFHGEYTLLCSKKAAITKIDFPFFKTFPKAQTLEVMMITDKGQKAFDVSRSHPVIDVRGIF